MVLMLTLNCVAVAGYTHSAHKSRVKLKCKLDELGNCVKAFLGLLFDRFFLMICCRFIFEYFMHVHVQCLMEKLCFCKYFDISQVCPFKRLCSKKKHINNFMMGNAILSKTIGSMQETLQFYSFPTKQFLHDFGGSLELWHRQKWTFCIKSQTGPGHLPFWMNLNLLL